MTPITDRLSALAAQMREDARQAGINATKARPAVEQAAADVAAARKLLAEAEKAHREAEAVVARHELDGQDAADMADKLDRLAAEHRTAPVLPTPDEAVAAAGLAPTPRRAMEVDYLTALVGQRVEVLTTSNEAVSGVLVRADFHARELHLTTPEGDQGVPLEFVLDVNPETPTADELPFNVVPASPQTVAAVEQATGELVAVHGPGVTAPIADRLAAERFPGPRHEKPKERPGPLARITRRTGPHRVIASPDATRPDTDVPDELLAEGERQARPDAPEGEK